MADGLKCIYWCLKIFPDMNWGSRFLLLFGYQLFLEKLPLDLMNDVAQMYIEETNTINSTLHGNTDGMAKFKMNNPLCTRLTCYWHISHTVFCLSYLQSLYSSSNQKNITSPYTHSLAIFSSSSLYVVISSSSIDFTPNITLMIKNAQGVDQDSSHQYMSFS